MKKCQTIFIIILIVLLCLMCSIYNMFMPKYKYNLSENSEPAASKILYDYILAVEGMSPKEIEKFANITPERVRAFEYDLNGDGTKEVIGIIYSTYCYGTAGYSLFILQKKENTYNDLTSVLNCEPLLPIKILKSRTNGYNDIKFYGGNAYNFKPFVAQYKNNKYDNPEQLQGLIDALRQ